MKKEDWVNKINTVKKPDEIENLVNDLMAIPIPWLFTNKFGVEANQKFQEFKAYMANIFKLPSVNFFITGSSLLGFSLTPEKILKILTKILRM